MQRRSSKTACMLSVAAILLCVSCTKIETPEEISSRSSQDAVVAAAAVITDAPEETTTTMEQTTTVIETTTTDQSLCTPFIDFDAEIDPERPMVALTFDDGPSKNTGTILDTLEAYNAHATFFVVGTNVNATSGATLQHAVSLGCEIGSHTYDHSDLVTMTPEQMDQEVQMTDDLVFDAIGRYPYWLRPPYGSFDDTVRLRVGKPLAFWSVDTKDWKTKNAASTVSAALNNVEDGDVVLMHDLYNETAAAVAQIVPSLIQQGYQLVTISELTYYRDVDMENGMIVFSMHPDNPNYKPAPNPAETTTVVTTIAAETETTASATSLP